MKKNKLLMLLPVLLVLVVFLILLGRGSDPSYTRLTLTAVKDGAVAETTDADLIGDVQAILKGKKTGSVGASEAVLHFDFVDREGNPARYTLWKTETGYITAHPDGSFRKGNTEKIEDLIFDEKFPVYDEYRLLPLRLSLGGEEFIVEPENSALQYSKLGLRSGSNITAAAEGEDRTCYIPIHDDTRWSVEGLFAGTSMEGLEFVVYENGVRTGTMPLTDCVDMTPLRDGEYGFELDLLLQEEDLFGTVRYNIVFTYDRGAQFNLSHESICPGDWITAYATVQPEDAVISLTTDLYGEEMPAITFIETEPCLYATVIPVPLETAIGEYTLTLTAQAGGKTMSEDFVITVKDKTFDVQNLKTDRKTYEENYLNPEADKESAEKLAPLLLKVTEEFYDTGVHSMPLTKRKINTEFGMRRFVNDELTSYRHSGVDLGSPGGTPVFAAASGRVIFADSLIRNGNTVVIDHGGGIMTLYCHLRSIGCSVGDMVASGDTIGKVGTTGFSTGNHLHYTLYMYGVVVDPLRAMETAPIQDALGSAWFK